MSKGRNIGKGLSEVGGEGLAVNAVVVAAARLEVVGHLFIITFQIHTATLSPTLFLIPNNPPIVPANTRIQQYRSKHTTYVC